MKRILIIKPGSIHEHTIKELRENDVIVIQHEKPEEVRVVSQFESLETDEVFLALAKGTNTEFVASANFGTNMLQTLIQKLTKK